MLHQQHQSRCPRAASGLGLLTCAQKVIQVSQWSDWSLSALPQLAFNSIQSYFYSPFSNRIVPRFFPG